MQHYYHRLVVTEDINNQILEAREQGKFYGKPYQFLKHLVMLGLREYRTQIETEKANRETRLQAAGCETATETIQPTGTKIIPFPGVTLNHEVTYQNALDDFLREMGYIE